MENIYKKLRMEKNPDEMTDYRIKDLSSDIGIAAPKISELENGRRTASLSELQAYHKHFDVPYEYLLGESQSRHYEYMVTSDEIGLSGNAMKKLHELAQNKTYAQLLNILIEKYITSLLLEISNGTTYMELSTEPYIDGFNRDKAKAYSNSLNTTNEKAMDALQKITNETGHIIRMITGEQNIEYCRLKTGEIMQNAVKDILYNWNPKNNKAPGT